ncbi:MAG: ribosome biogenesis GTPase Der [Patescibacteria group bacterium]
MKRIVGKKNKLVAIVGRPNVGKSSLFNKILGYQKSIVCDWEGTTRDRILALAEWQGQYFWLLDTAGILRQFELGGVEESAMKQVEYSVQEADLVLFMVDGKDGMTNEDKRLWERMRKYQPKIRLVVNKVDSPALEIQAQQFYELGVKDYYLTSAMSGRGVGDLLDDIVGSNNLNKSLRDDFNDELRVCILGRPNVGKSTLINKLCGLDRMTVGPVAGTTRDAGEIEIKYDSESFWLVDTAGLLSPGRYRKKDINRFSYMHALAEARRANIAVVVIDGAEGLTRMDVSIVSLAVELGLGIILFVNKWDLVTNQESNQEKFMRVLQRRLGFAYWVPIVFGSALVGKNVNIIKKKLLEISAKYRTIIEAEQLAHFVSQISESNFQIARLGINRIKQVASSPPKFEVSFRHKKSLSCHNEKLMERLIRDYFSLTGVAIKLVWR